MPRSLRLRAASAVSSTHSTEGGRTISRFHIRSAAKRRGGVLPARLRFSVHRGVTLIELMISMLILTLVCVAWLEIIGIQSARKEARRREAVERLAGMMDAILYDPVTLKVFNKNKKTGKITATAASYCLKTSNYISAEKLTDDDEILPVFANEVSSIGYRLKVLLSKDKLDCSEKFVTNKEFGNNWCNNDGPCYWLVGELYDHYGKKENDWVPFFTLPVCMGR